MGRRDRNPLAPYEDLIDLCRAREFRVHLDVGREGWTLDIFEAGELIARGTSTQAPPGAWRECAAHALAGLSRSGKAKP